MTNSAEEQAPQQRTRKSHTRSRTGCLTCRKRHRRCDEQRPIWPCEYPTPGLPLRERRKPALPGEQQPWKPEDEAPALPLSRAVGPCLSQPIKMPFKSNELFHYFYELEDAVDIMPREKRQDLLSYVMQSPDALRNTMLIAGFHFAWNAGHLHAFEPTVLFHKIETMRLINGWLEQSRPKAYSVCVRQIATLCFTECALGSVATAETHLNGLMRFMDYHRPPHLLDQTDMGVEDELSNRYIILTYNFIYGFKSRLQDILDEEYNMSPGEQPTSHMVEDLMHSWHKEEFRGLEIRLKAMKMMPYFFTPLTSTTKFRQIDGSPMLDCLISLTETARIRYQSPDAQTQQLVWLEGAATRLLLAFVGSHIESLSGDEKGGLKTRARLRLSTSWSGMASASGLYLHAVLGFWNAGEPIEARLLRRVLSILKQDLERHRPDHAPRLASDLWFWKAFVAAFSMSKHLQLDHQGILSPLEQPFRDVVREWSEMNGVTQWTKARKSLAKIVWPETFHLEDLAEEVWNRCISS
ncbi:hypothetical protein FALBO_8106 [Fusarium albosuccineum]|uniref:Zn(2)-C6 fungal-type domain-containing protein n=1 Tax=Fusarium albosuccineum TaxID=1237068 RepID=A0A8H4PJJ0_9HYPO|nr:hypothetical protein FALBO_8106 [Fusarium albosuccineum]